MTLTKGIIIQLNTTIIAGLLILLTIQSIGNPPLDEIIYEAKLLENRLENLQDFKSNLTRQIDISGSQYEEKLNEKIIEAQLAVSEAKAKFDIYAESPQVIIFSPQKLASILIIPFAMSLIIELVDGSRHPKKSEPHRSSIMIIAIGLIYVAFFLLLRSII